MLQTGTLYSITNNENSVEIKQPIPNVFIYFSQNNARKLTAKTDSAGKFSFDLPLGSYQVTVSRGVEAPIYQIAGGAPFELTSSSKQNAFEQWVLAPVYLKPEENPLVVLMNNLVLDARKSATEAKASADKAEQTMKNKRDIDDNNFDGEILVKAKNSTVTGVFLQDSSGNVGGQMVSNSYGLQFAQIQEDGTSQTFTFPRYGDGGEIAMKADVDSKWDTQETVGDGKVMLEGAGGLLSSHTYSAPKNVLDFIYESGSSFVRIDSNTSLAHQYGPGILTLGGSNFGIISIHHITGAVRVSSGNRSSQRVNDLLGTLNTTVDSNGFIKKASPIIRLFDDKIETNDQFKEEPIFEKISVGTYKISNTLGLAKEGWTYEKPRGKDGNPYFHIKVTKLDDGCIISVHDVFEALEEATITDIDGNERKINRVVKILGEARDIKPHERWIDLRFHEEPEEIEEMEDFEEE